MQRGNEKAHRGATHDGLREQCRKQADYTRKLLNPERNRYMVRGGGMRQ